MNHLQKMAWFNLAIITLAVAAYLILLPLIGPMRALSGFAFLGILGFSVLFVNKRKNEVIADERDKEIGYKSTLAGYTVFWLYYVSATVIIPFTRDFKDIPVYLWFGVLWFGFIIIMAVRSVTTLVLYRADTTESGTLLEGFRNMSNLQKNALMGLIIILVVLTPFILFFPVQSSELPAKVFGILVCISFGIVFLPMKRAYKNIEMNEQDEKICRRAQTLALLGVEISLTLGIIVLGVLYFLGGAEWISLNSFLYIIFCSLAVGLLTMQVAIIVLYGHVPEAVKDAEK